MFVYLNISKKKNKLMSFFVDTKHIHLQKSAEYFIFVFKKEYLYIKKKKK